MVKTISKFHKTGVFKMPHFSILLPLSRVVKGTNMVVLFLLMMYDAVLREICGNSVCPMIPDSQAVIPHIIAILRDIRGFSFFSRDELFFMLMHHGMFIHLLRGICMPKYLLHKSRGVIMRSIMNRVLRRWYPYLVGRRTDPLILDIMKSYPITWVKSQLLDIKVVSFHHRLAASHGLRFFLRLLVLLPKPQAAIRKIFKHDLASCDQMENYKKVVLFALFRELAIEKNEVLMLLCKFLDLSYGIEKRSINPLRIQFEEDFCRARTSRRDYRKFRRFFDLISEFYDIKLTSSFYEMDWCLFILDFFLENIWDNHWSDWQFFAEVFKTKTVDGVLSLLETGFYTKDVDVETHFTLRCKLEFPPNQSDGTSPAKLQLKMNVFYALQNARSLKLDVYYLYINDQDLDIMTYYSFTDITVLRWSHLLSLLFAFIELVQSNHPHLSFLIESYIFVKSHSTSFDPLVNFLDLGHVQEFREFDTIFHTFRRISNSAAEFSHKTAEELFIEFFDLMLNILSNKNFFEYFEGYTLYRRSLHGFIDHLMHKYSHLVDQIQLYYLFCCECSKRLPPDRAKFCEICYSCDAWKSQPSDSSSDNDDKHDAKFRRSFLNRK